MVTKLLKKGFIGCATIMGASFVAVTLFLVYWGFSLSDKKKELAQNIILTIESPENVALEQEFIIDLYIENNSSKNYKLSDIDVPPEYFGGVDIFDSQPQFHDRFIGLATGDQSYKFNTTIPPKKITKISLVAFAKTSGNYRSFFDICLDSPSTCIGKPIKTVVN